MQVLFLCVCGAVQEWARDLAGQVDHIDVSLFLALLYTMGTLPAAPIVRVMNVSPAVLRCLPLLWLSCVWLRETGSCHTSDCKWQSAFLDTSELSPCL